MTTREVLAIVAPKLYPKYGVPVVNEVVCQVLEHGWRWKEDKSEEEALKILSTLCRLHVRGERRKGGRRSTLGREVSVQTQDYSTQAMHVRLDLVSACHAASVQGDEVETVVDYLLGDITFTDLMEAEGGQKAWRIRRQSERVQEYLRLIPS